MALALISGATESLGRPGPQRAKIQISGPRFVHYDPYSNLNMRMFILGFPWPSPLFLGPRRVSPQSVSHQSASQQSVSHHNVSPHSVSHQNVSPHSVSPQSAQRFTPERFTHRKRPSQEPTGSVAARSPQRCQDVHRSIMRQTKEETARHAIK